jgi:hypothetical protein
VRRRPAKRCRRCGKAWLGRPRCSRRTRRRCWTQMWGQRQGLHALTTVWRSADTMPVVVNPRMFTMNTRRRFIQTVPVAGLVPGLALLGACSDKSAAPAPAPSTSTTPPAPSSAPAPAPAPTVAAPTPAPTTAPAAAMPMVGASDPIAISLGYVAVATQADATKFPNYAPGLACSNCALFQGKAGDAAGGCPLFSGKQVASGGWCSSHVKKAG